MTVVSNYAITVVLCLYTVCQSVISTIGQYIYASYLQTYPSSSNTTENLTVSFVPSLHRLKAVNDVSQQCFNNSATSYAQVWAQEQSADLFFRIDLWNSCPVMIMTFILGFYTPTLGRRLVLTLPILGIVSQLAIWLAIIYFHLSDYWWYVGSFMVGLSGSSYVFHFVMSLIIADSTTENNRSSRFVLFEAMTTAVSALATFGIGYYIDWRGFTDLYWISLALAFVSMGIVIVFFKDTTTAIDERTPLLSDSDVHIQNVPSPKASCQNCMLIFRIFSFKGHSRRKSIVLLLTLLAYTFYLLAYSTYSTFLWYLLDTPFCWSSENVGNYTALASICCAVFSLLGMKLLTSLRASDIAICALSHVFFAASSLWITFARHSWQLYAGLLIGPYADYQSSLTLPIMSRWLQEHERNHAFTLVAEVSTIVTTFGDSLFNWIYARTVVDYRNSTLFIAVGFSLASLVLNICLLCVTRRTSIEPSSPDPALEPARLPVTDDAHPVDVVFPIASMPPSRCSSPSPVEVGSRADSQSSLNEDTPASNDLIVL